MTSSMLTGNESVINVTSMSESSSTRMYRIIINVYVVGVLCVVGITGNLVSIVII